MAVLYRLSQNKMSTSKAKGKWFAQAVMTGTIDTDALAEIMQRNCTVKKSDIYQRAHRDYAGSAAELKTH